MISATSSLASGILSSAFGTPSQSTTSIPSPSTGSTTTQASIVDALPASPESSLLANIAFAQDTEFLLDDPNSNGAISGTPTSYVQQIISKLAPGATTTSTSNDSQNSATATAATSSSNSTPTSLPPEGVLA